MCTSCCGSWTARRSAVPPAMQWAGCGVDRVSGAGRQEAAEEESGIQTMDAKSFKVDGEVFRAGDHVFLLPGTFDQLPAATVDDQEAVPTYAAKSRHVKVLPPPWLPAQSLRKGAMTRPVTGSLKPVHSWRFTGRIASQPWGVVGVSTGAPLMVQAAAGAQGGANAGLRAYGVGRIVSVGAASAAKKGGRKGAPAAAEGQVTVQRYYRPEDVSRDAAYTAAFTDVYLSDDRAVVELGDVVGRCHVLPPGSPLAGAPPRCCSRALHSLLGGVEGRGEPPGDTAAALLWTRAGGEVVCMVARRRQQLHQCRQV